MHTVLQMHIVLYAWIIGENIDVKSDAYYCKLWKLEYEKSDSLTEKWTSAIGSFHFQFHATSLRMRRLTGCLSSVSSLQRWMFDLLLIAENSGMKDYDEDVNGYCKKKKKKKNTKRKKKHSNNYKCNKNSKSQLSS